MAADAITEKLVESMKKCNGTLIRYWSAVAKLKMIISGWPLDGCVIETDKNPDFVFRWHLKHLIIKSGNPYSFRTALRDKLIVFDDATRCLGLVIADKTEDIWLNSKSFLDLCSSAQYNGNGLPWSDYLPDSFSERKLNRQEKLAASLCHLALDNFLSCENLHINFSDIERIKEAEFFSSNDLKNALQSIHARFLYLGKEPHAYFFLNP